MNVLCLCFINFAIYHNTKGIIIYVIENSTDILRCPLKADLYSVFWVGPPNFTRYTLGTKINPNLQQTNRLSVVSSEYNLQISNIQQTDEGVYRCTGTLNGYLASALIELTITVPPTTNPMISIDPTVNIIAGSNVKLICTIYGGKPLANITWECTGSGQPESGSDTSTAVSTVQFVVSKHDNGKICQCIGTHRLWTSQKTADITMDVKYTPNVNPSIQQIPAGGIVRANQVKLTCTVTGGNPLATLTWDCDGITANETTGNTVSYSVTFIVNKTDNNKICTCSATHLVSSYRPTINHRLTVYFEPTNYPIINQTPPGYIISGNNVVLTCDVTGGNPLAILSWNCTGILTNNTSVNTASYSLEQTVDRTFNNRVCACSATHPVTSYKPNVRHIFVIYYIPDNNPLIEQEPAGGIIAGNKVMLRCTVSGGNPLATLSWNCQGNIINNTLGTTASYSVEFAVDKTYNNRICTCSATHPVESYRPSKSHMLIVFYVPEDNLSVQQVPNIGIINHHKVQLRCSLSGGNPLAILSWDCKGNFTNSTTPTMSSYSVEFTVEKNDNSRLCTCTATHVIASFKTQVQHKLVVYYGPVNIPTIRQIPNGGIVNGNTVTLTCEVSGGNPLAILIWNCSGIGINNTAGDNSSYSVVFSVNKNDNKKICACTTVHPDTSNLHTVQRQLLVYYGPSLPRLLHKPGMPWFEGHTSKLECIYEEGNPVAMIIWKKDEIVILDESNPILELRMVSKNDFNSSVICIVSNDYGRMESDALYLNIEFKPFLDTTGSNSASNMAIFEHDNLFITVSVKSNPYPIITWKFIAQEDTDCCNNNVFNTSSTIVGFHSSSNITIENVERDQFGEYIFMAKNLIGTFHRKFRVQEKGQSIGPSFVYVVCKSTSAVVIWKSDLNGVYLEEDFYVQYTDMENNNMSSNRILSNSTHTHTVYTVNGLYPDKTYYFTVISVSLLGKSRYETVECITDTACPNQDNQAVTSKNWSVFGAGIATLLFGLAALLPASICVIRNCLKSKNIPSSTSDEYINIQRSNPTFTDAYSTLQSHTESKILQENSTGTYEEYGKHIDASANQNMDKTEHSPEKSQTNEEMYCNMKI